MVRYPKAGKGNKWTILELRSIPLEWKGDTLSDGEGLNGEVRIAANGAVSVRWKWAFRWQGKIAWYQCGTWPKVSLGDVRQRRDQARRLVADGVHPAEHQQAERIRRQEADTAAIAQAARERTERLAVRDLFDSWIGDGVARRDRGAELRRTFGKDVMPSIGDKPVRDVTEADIRSVLRAVVERGCNRTAVLMLANLRQMFRWAEKRPPWRRLLIEGNPADLVRAGTITSGDYQGNERSRVLSPKELCDLRDKLREARATYEGAPDKRRASRPLSASSEAVIWIMLATTCRVGEIARAKWENVDLDAGTWLIPAKDSKNAKPHMVYLSDYACRYFKALRKAAGEKVHVLPAKNKDGHVCPKSLGKQIADRQRAIAGRKPMKNRSPLTNGLALAGGRWTAHDLRRTGATLMAGLGVKPLIVDRCLNHVEGNMLRRVYQVHDYADEKREAWRLLGERIETILTKNVVPLERAA